MLSYRHSFHAGNHGDVLKHICQMIIIEKLKKKDKGFCYFDTHSGAGIYNLTSEASTKTNEFRQGVQKLATHSAKNEHLANYLLFVSAYKKFEQYPGSPEIAQSMLRPQDKVLLMELHNQEVQKLKSNVGGKNVAVHHRDGYEGILALTPPEIKRGMVLIDPSYEVANEYERVVKTVCDVHKKWNSAIFAIWYPLLSDRKTTSDTFDSSSSKKGKSEAMLESLSHQPFKNLLSVELCVTAPNESGGMYGSGLAIINAPWQLDQQISASLEELTPLLAQSKQATSSINWLIKEKTSD